MTEQKILTVKPTKFKLWTSEVLFFKGCFEKQNVFIKLYLHSKKNQRECRILEYINTMESKLILPTLISDDVFSGGYFVVLEELTAKSLTTILDKISFEIFDNIIDQFICILNEFNQMNLIHCDITPDNIMITNNNKLIIIDFEYSIIKGNRSYQDFSFAETSVLKSLGGEHSMPGHVWDDAYSFLSVAKKIVKFNNFNESDLDKISYKFDLLESQIGVNYYKN